MPVFASNWCLRSARVSASSWMSISSNKSSHTKLEGVCSQQRLRQHLGWTFDTRVCGACDARRERMGRVRSARCNIFYSLAGERFSGVRRMRLRQHLGWTFRLGTRWASEGARRRAGTHPPGQQGPEPARRQRRREEQSFFAWASREQQQACRVKAAE